MGHTIRNSDGSYTHIQGKNWRSETKRDVRSMKRRRPHDEPLKAFVRRLADDGSGLARGWLKRKSG